jgi:hypothetical protein
MTDARKAVIRYYEAEADARLNGDDVRVVPLPKGVTLDTFRQARAGLVRDGILVRTSAGRFVTKDSATAPTLEQRDEGTAA